MTTTMTFVETVRAAIATVDDPEYPGISIVALGLLESIDFDATTGTVSVSLIPTFAGCPALAMIADDVAVAVRTIGEVDHVSVNWLRSPVWTTDRITPEARSALANQFTVAVQLGAKPVTCPRCNQATEARSEFGPNRCRSVRQCRTCREVVEVMRA